MTENKCSGTVFVDWFTDGVLDPSKPILGPVLDSGFIVANTAPECWEPMITPELKGGHEATVAGAIEIGRAPGVVMVTFRCPVAKLAKAGLLPLVKQQYGL